MLAAIQRFGHALRSSGLPVSSDDIATAARAATFIELGERSQLRAALRVSLVRHRADGVLFDRLFDAVFDHALDDGIALDQQLRAQLGRGASQLRAALAESSELAKALAGMRPGDLDSLAAAAGVSLGIGSARSTLQSGSVAYRLAAAMGLEEAETEALSALATLPEDQADVAAALIRQRVADVREALRRRTHRELVARYPRRRRQLSLAQLETRSLASLSPTELRELAVEVDRLARALVRARQRQRRHRKRGRLDIARTLRSSVACDGVPMVPRFIAKRRRRPRIVVLCDVSDSVRNVSRFMLQLVYSLARITAGVRSFAFVADIGETTDVFRHNSIATAIERVASGEVVNVLANSNYGRAMSQFAARHLGSVTSRTTVVIIGDGRSNYHDPGLAALSSIRARAGRLVWLNPEPESIWGFGDSAMSAYRALCDQIAVAGSLAALREIVDELV